MAHLYTSRYTAHRQLPSGGLGQCEVAIPHLALWQQSTWFSMRHYATDQQPLPNKFILPATGIVPGSICEWVWCANHLVNCRAMRFSPFQSAGFVLKHFEETRRRFCHRWLRFWWILDCHRLVVYLKMSIYILLQAITMASHLYTVSKWTSFSTSTSQWTWRLALPVWSSLSLEALGICHERFFTVNRDTTRLDILW